MPRSFLPQGRACSTAISKRSSILGVSLISINRKTDRLLVVSNGTDGDAIAKRAIAMGIPTECGVY